MQYFRRNRFLSPDWKRYVAWFILNCTNIHGCLYYQVNFTAVVAVSVIFSVSIYYCHKDWYVLVVI